MCMSLSFTKWRIYLVWFSGWYEKSTDRVSNAVPHGQNANVRLRRDVANIIFIIEYFLKIENDLKISMPGL